MKTKHEIMEKDIIKYLDETENNIKAIEKFVQEETDEDKINEYKEVLDGLKKNKIRVEKQLIELRKGFLNEQH